MKHANAHDIFPEEQVKEIKKHYSGGYIFIPKRSNKERDENIRALYESGAPVKAIAGEMGLTERRLRQICKKNHI